MNGKRIRPLRFATLVLAILFIAAPSVPVAAEARRDAVAANGMVASAHPEASRIGVEILEAGGNAVDAAVAVGFALGVVEPNASGIGGGGLMLLWLAEREQVVFIDFREKAPTGAVPDLFELDEDGKVKPDTRGFDPAQIGGRSVAVPGEVAGLLLAHEEFGSMSRAAVMQPAIERAEQGVVVSEVLAGMIAEHYDTLLAYPASATIYLSDDFPKMPGDLVRNTDLAGTLRRVAQQGRDGFYTGPVAESIVAAVQAGLGASIDEVATAAEQAAPETSESQSAAAPAPSARLCVSSYKQRIASAISSSVTVTIRAAPSRTIPRAASLGIRQAMPSAKVLASLVGTGRPASKESATVGAPAETTPTISVESPSASRAAIMPQMPRNDAAER